eukprot:PhF_6_TR8644/c0_g1_i1/m.13504/K00344/qor, CRYZ; NADPH2:quinone reductase
MSIQVVEAGSPNSMKAWILEKPTGKISDIHPAVVSIPQPGPGEVRVKIVAATTNPVDYKRASFEGWPAYPAVFGVDGAGVVDAVGEGVTITKIGDRVHFFNDVSKAYGSFGEYSIIKALGAVPIPDNVSFETAAVVPCAAWTAYEVLFDRLRIQPGKYLIVNSASGGVGHLAVQLALNAGTKVIAIASGEWCAKFKEQGCLAAIDYRTQDIKTEVMAVTNNKGADYAFDMIDDKTAHTLMGCLRFCGSIAHISTTMTPPESGLFMQGITTHHVFIPGHFFHGDDYLTAFRGYGIAVAKELSDGKLKPLISKTIGFDGIREQLIDQEKGVVKGKVLIKY